MTNTTTIRSWPILYKKASTGKIQSWQVETYNSTISTYHGQVDGKIQRSTDVVNEGKNQGRSNETTAIEQAQAEAQSKWEKQVKKGYVEDINKAKRGIKDIVGGVDCMLAHKYSEQGHKIKFPAFAQPKLDGIRCLAIVKDGKCTLWTRTRKAITSMPHIQKAVEQMADGEDLIFDGELYNHNLKADFEKIVSLVRKEEPSEGYTQVEYHIYDVVDHTAGFEERNYTVGNAFFNNCSDYLVEVPTSVVNSEEELMEEFEQYRSQGYEGAMVRNTNGKYVGKRSYDLLKIKEFDDAEFEIIGVREGRGKLAGHAATFVCVDDKKAEFDAKMKGELSRLKDYWEDHSLWKGKKLTVQYQGFTGANAVPRFGIGIALRDYE